jgi:hypothetical protein
MNDAYVIKADQLTPTTGLNFSTDWHDNAVYE